MTEGEFRKSQDDAIRRMREMSDRAASNKANGFNLPSPDFVRLRNGVASQQPPKPAIETSQNNFSGDFSPPKNSSQINRNHPQSNGFNLPFLDSILKDGDSTLIIGLLLLLMSEKTDKILLFALVYILL